MHRHLALAILISLVATAAHAVCTIPGGTAGDAFFNTTTKTMQYCNGNQWVNTGTSVPAAANTGCTTPTGIAGSVIYNSPSGVVQFCNGENWVNTACAATRSPNGSGCTGPTGTAGQVIYESTANEMQFCDSTNWVAMGWPCAAAGLVDWDKAYNLGKIYSSPPVGSGSFGTTSMSISGDTLVVGSYSENSGQGAVYVYVRNGNNWTQQARIVSPYAQNNSYFGWNVSVDGNSLAISQPSWNDTPASRNSVGRVFVFTRTGSSWSQQAEFSPNNVAYSYFGNNMVFIQDTILSYWQSNLGRGTVYAYKRTGSTWAVEAALTPATPENSDYFGNPLLALQGDTALIGRRGSNGSAITAFSRSGSTWTRGVRISMPGESDSGFMGALILSDDIFVAGGQYDSAPAYMDGSVYVYKKVSGSWTKSARLTMPSLTGTTAHFGKRVELSADKKTIFVGGNFQAVQVFRENSGTWSHFATISSTDTIANGGFGASFVLDGSRNLLVAAPGDDDNAVTNSGSVYRFSLAPPASPSSPFTWNSTSPLPSVQVDNAVNFTPNITYTGSGVIMFSIANKPSFASFNSATGQLSGTPSSGEEGTYSFTITADDSSQSSGKTFSLTITP